MLTIREILNSNDPVKVKAIFTFSLAADGDEKIILKYRIWSRYYFPRYFTSKDAPFHKSNDLNNLKAYRGSIESFTDITFRGGAKTARTKLFIAFCIANDQDHFRRYIKVLAADSNNSKQIVTDIYNMLVKDRIRVLYPEIFEKTESKREETMQSFTTTAGVKIVASTVGTDQRGSLQEEARPDLEYFEDFENRTTLRSTKKTRAIWDNMEEARTGLAKNGACIYNCNYISEMGNVHKLVQKESPRRIVSIIPILDKAGNPTWDRYTKAEIAQMKIDDDDFEGERMCKPSASKDILFDRESLDKQIEKEPVRISAGLKIFKEFNPSHRYGSGHDVSGGMALDSATSVFMNFEVLPAQVVGTFANNTIKPDVFGDEIKRESDIFGGNVVGIEKNNHGHATIARAKQLGVKQYKTQGKQTKVGESTPTEYGWHTNALTKPKMIFALAKAVEDGLLELSDKNLIAECKSYSRNDLLDDEKDPRLTTRHFDLLMAAAIAWQMKDFAEVEKKDEPFIQEEDKILYSDIGI